MFEELVSYADLYMQLYDTAFVDVQEMQELGANSLQELVELLQGGGLHTLPDFRVSGREDFTLGRQNRLTISSSILEKMPAEDVLLMSDLTMGRDVTVPLQTLNMFKLQLQNGFIGGLSDQLLNNINQLDIKDLNAPLQNSANALTGGQPQTPMMAQVNPDQSASISQLPSNLSQAAVGNSSAIAQAAAKENILAGQPSTGYQLPEGITNEALNASGKQISPLTKIKEARNALRTMAYANTDFGNSSGLGMWIPSMASIP